MPTKNERISLVKDTEEVTPVKAPPPGLILESKMLPLDDSFPIVDIDDERATETPPPILAPMTGTNPEAGGKTTVKVMMVQAPAQGREMSRETSRETPPAPLPALIPRRPRRAVVDLVPFTPSQTPGPFLVPRGIRVTPRPMPGGSAWASAARPRSGAGLYVYLALAALLVAGGGLLGWRQWWSVRPGRIEISTLPTDAAIAVGGRALKGSSPMTVEAAPGAYTISVTRAGYARSDRTIDLHPGQEVVLAIALSSLTGAAGPAPIVGAIEPEKARASATTAVRRAAGTGAPGARSVPARPFARTDTPAPAVRTMPQILDPDSQPSIRAQDPTTTPTPTPAPPATATASAEPREMAPPTGLSTNVDKIDSPSPAGAGSSARTIAGRIARAQLTIDPNADEYRVKMPPSLARAEMKLSAVVKLCVSAEGKVADVKLLKPADPAIDSQIPVVLGKWRYRPLITNGQPTPFCYVLQYEITAP